MSEAGRHDRVPSLQAVHSTEPNVMEVRRRVGPSSFRILPVNVREMNGAAPRLEAIEALHGRIVASGDSPTEYIPAQSGFRG